MLSAYLFFSILIIKTNRRDVISDTKLQQGCEINVSEIGLVKRLTTE